MYKYLKSFARRTVIVATILSLSCASVIADDGPKIHPLAYMLYQRAFDPVTLKDFRNFLESVGVSGENLKMFTPKKPGWFSRWFGSPEVEVPELEEDINLSGFETSAGWKAYMAERSSQLNSAKLWALTTRSREALNFLITLAVSTTITLSTIGSDSLGGSLMFSAAMASMCFGIYEASKDLWNILRIPPHPVDELELIFLKNMCFIPHELWAPISDAFGQARQNQFSQNESLSYLTFVLNLTITKPSKALLPPRVYLPEVTRKIFTSIDNFFLENYEMLQVDEESFRELKETIRTFVFSLLPQDPEDNIATERTEQHKSLYLTGPGGIGKTHFMKLLTVWIEKAVGATNLVNFHNIPVGSLKDSAALTGDKETPGLWMKILNNQRLEETNGSVVAIDEANGLINNEELTESLKACFDPGSETCSSEYIKGERGANISFKKPNTLIICAANTEIKEEKEEVKGGALKSRFVEFRFPNPTVKALICKAWTTYNNKPTASKYPLTKKVIQEFFEKHIKPGMSFRDMWGVVAKLLRYEYTAVDDVPTAAGDHVAIHVKDDSTFDDSAAGTKFRPGVASHEEDSDDDSRT